MAFQAILAAVFFSVAVEAPADANDAPMLPPSAVLAPNPLPKSLVGNRRVDPLLARPSAAPAKVEETDKPAKTVRSRIGSALNRVSSPVTKWLHGESSTLDDRKPKELAAEASKNRKFTPEIEAINYLASLDSNSYPEIIDSLLASLDDPSPSVRRAVLQSVHRKANDRQHLCNRDMRFTGVGNVDCPACKSCRKIVARLESLLLDVDERGALKERSEANRDLALAIMLALDSKEAPGSATEFASDQKAIEVPPSVPANRIDMPPLPQFEPPADAQSQSPARSKFKMFRWFEGGNKSAELDPKSAKR